jgi:hypothetical protein
MEKCEMLPILIQESYLEALNITKMVIRGHGSMLAAFKMTRERPFQRSSTISIPKALIPFHFL